MINKWILCLAVPAAAFAGTAVADNTCGEGPGGQQPACGTQDTCSDPDWVGPWWTRCCYTAIDGCRILQRRAVTCPGDIVGHQWRHNGTQTAGCSEDCGWMSQCGIS
jgi:hypothetical protein